MIADPEIIPDAAYNPATDLIEIIGPGGQVFFSLSILGAAIFEACITKAQTVGSMYRMKKNVGATLAVAQGDRPVAPTEIEDD